MAPRLWDPDRVLQITEPGRNDMFCVGRARRRFNARCSWKINDPEYPKVCSILDRMATQEPDTVSIEQLERLARLSLCKDYHQDQQDEVVEGWQERIENAVKDYMRFRKLEKRNMLLEAQIEKMRAEGQGWLSLLGGVDDSTDEIFSLLKSRLDALSNQNKEKLALSSQLSSTQTDLERARLSLAYSRQLNAELEELVSNLRAQLGELEHQFSRQGQATEDLEEGKLVLSNQLTNTKRDLEQAQLDLAETHSTIQDLRASTSSSQARLNELQTHVDRAQDENSSLAAQHTSLSQALLRSQLELADSHKTNIDLSVAAAEVPQLRRHISELEAQLSAGWLGLFKRGVVAAGKSISTWVTRVTDAFAKWRQSRSDGPDEIEHGSSEAEELII